MERSPAREAAIEAWRAEIARHIEGTSTKLEPSVAEACLDHRTGLS